MQAWFPRHHTLLALKSYCIVWCLFLLTNSPRHIITAFKHPKGHHVEQKLLYPVQLLRSKLGQVDFFIRRQIYTLYHTLGSLGNWLWDGDFYVGSLSGSAVGINNCGESEGSRIGQSEKLNGNAVSTKASANPMGLIWDDPAELSWVEARRTDLCIFLSIQPRKEV